MGARAAIAVGGELALLEPGARGGVRNVQAAAPDRIGHMREGQVVADRHQASQAVVVGVIVGLFDALERPVGNAEDFDATGLLVLV